MHSGTGDDSSNGILLLSGGAIRLNELTPEGHVEHTIERVADQPADRIDTLPRGVKSWVTSSALSNERDFPVPKLRRKPRIGITVP